MNAYIINPDTKELISHEYDAQPNSVYSLFGSILIDSSRELNHHVVHTDGYATDNGETPFFIGEKLFLGRALICGVDGFEEKDVSINEEELLELINYEVNDFYKNCLLALSKEKISINKNFDLTHQDEKIQLNYEWVIYTFNMADKRTQEYFLSKLDESIAKNESISEYFQDMAKRALQATS
jgi:hypothetical protein